MPSIDSDQLFLVLSNPIIISSLEGNRQELDDFVYFLKIIALKAGLLCTFTTLIKKF